MSNKIDDTLSNAIQCSGFPFHLFESHNASRKRKSGRPPTYDFDILADMYQYDDCDISPMVIDVSSDDDIKKRLTKVSTALCLYKKRRGVNWDTAVRRGEGCIKVYRLN